MYGEYSGCVMCMWVCSWCACKCVHGGHASDCMRVHECVHECVHGVMQGMYSVVHGVYASLR